LIIELTEVEVRVIVQAMKVWVGDFPETNCIPSLIWKKELRELIKKLQPFFKEHKMDMDDLIDQFVGDLAFEVLIIWADILNVEHDEDMWTDCESDLRQKVTEAMGKVGEKKK
jgi:hypothetical protein